MNMNSHHAIRETSPQFAVSLAQTSTEREEAFRLRYRVFVEELGAGGSNADHTRAMEMDEYDALSDHLLLRDSSRPEGQQVVGVYRLLQEKNASRIGGFYTESEFDLTRLKSANRPMLELGRSCIAPEYRGSTALLHLWQAVGRYVTENDIEILFGTASFQGAEANEHVAALSFLHTNHLAPETLRPVARGPRHELRLLDASIDHRAVQRNLPSLIKSYLRMGGCVGDGAFVDHAFNTTDVCMIVDVAAISPRQRALYTQ